MGPAEETPAPPLGWCYSYTAYEHTVPQHMNTQFHSIWTHSYTAYEHTVTQHMNTQFHSIWTHSYTAYEHTVTQHMNTQLHSIWTHSYTAYEHTVTQHMNTQFHTNTFINIVYSNTDIKPITENLTFYIWNCFNVRCNISFKERLPEDGHSSWPKRVWGYTVYNTGVRKLVTQKSAVIN